MDEQDFAKLKPYSQGFFIAWEAREKGCTHDQVAHFATILEPEFASGVVAANNDYDRKVSE